MQRRKTTMLPRKRSQLELLTCVVVTMMMSRRNSNVEAGYSIITISGSSSSSSGGSGSSSTLRRRPTAWSKPTASSRSAATTASAAMLKSNHNRQSTTVAAGALHHHSDDIHPLTASSLKTTTTTTKTSLEDVVESVGSDHAGHDETGMDRRQAFSRFLTAIIGTAAGAVSTVNPSPSAVAAWDVMDRHDEDATSASSSSAARFLSIKSKTGAEKTTTTTTTTESYLTTTTTRDMRGIKAGATTTTTTMTMTSNETAAAATAENKNDPKDWTASPLTLSLLAGLSTCVGAAVVFCARGGEGGANNVNDSTTTRSSPLTDAHMAFSLALAGSVMVTVSVVSILPESFQDESYAAGVGDSFRFLSFGSVLFLQRCCSFLVGCALYALLSKCAFPEPDTILGLDSAGGNIDHDNDALTKNNDSELTGQLLQACTSFGSHHRDEESTTVLLGTASGSQHSSPSSNRLNKKDYEGIDSSPFSTPSRKTNIKNSQQQQPYLRLIRPQQSSIDDDDDDIDNRATNSSSTSLTPSRKTSIKGSQQIPYQRNNRLQQQSSSVEEEDARQISDPPPLLQSSSSVLLQEEDADEEARGYTNKKSNKILLDARLSTWTRLSRYSSGADLQTDEARRAWRVAMLLFISLAIHNFPEGLAVAVSSMHSQRLGVTTTIAIALHNIPEGIAIAVPCLAARPESPWLAFGLASLSGLAEPLGAFVAMYFLQGSNEQSAIVSMNDILAFVAGIMIMVAVSELFPEACRHSKTSRVPFILGLVLGAVVMVGTELILS